MTTNPKREDMVRKVAEHLGCNAGELIVEVNKLIDTAVREREEEIIAKLNNLPDTHGIKGVVFKVTKEEIINLIQSKKV